MVSVTTLFLYAQPSVIPEWENIVTFCPKHPIKWDQNLQFIYMYTPKQDDKHHCHFYMGVHPPYPPGVSPQNQFLNFA